MTDARESMPARLAKLAVLVALALAGQYLVRWIAGRYVVGVRAAGQRASIAIDWILLACVPFGFFAAPTLSISATPLLDRGLRREPAAREFNRALYRSLVLVFVSLAAGMALLMVPHTNNPAGGVSVDAPIPLPFAILLAVAAPLREEIEFRLGLLTVLAWILYRLMRRMTENGRSPGLLVANVAQAMLFGALHQLVGFTGRTSALSLVGVVLEPRTICGLILGYGYIHYGLEVAIMTHMIYDGSISLAVAMFSRN